MSECTSDETSVFVNQNKINILMKYMFCIVIIQNLYYNILFWPRSGSVWVRTGLATVHLPSIVISSTVVIRLSCFKTCRIKCRSSVVHFFTHSFTSYFVKDFFVCNSVTPTNLYHHCSEDVSLLYYLLVETVVTFAWAILPLHLTPSVFMILFPR